MGSVRKLLIIVTNYAWLLLLLGPVTIGASIQSQWKAEGDHAYQAREQLASVAGTVTGASEVTVTRKRRTTKKYYEITVRPEAGGEERKLRIDHSTQPALVSNLIDEKVTALVDSTDHDLVYEIVTGGQAVITYENTKQRLLADAKSTAESFSGVGTWVLAIFLTLAGAGGMWANRKMRRTQKQEEEQAAAAAA